LRRSHFEFFAPLCPRCLSAEGRHTRLELADVFSENDTGIGQGVLHCPNDTCRQEYPIIDGVPIIVPDLRIVLGSQHHFIELRSDLNLHIEDMIGDALGDASEFHVRRQHLSIYGWDGYGEFDGPGNVNQTEEPGAVARCLQQGIAMLDDLAGPIVDLGCAVGRSSFELATGTDEMVLGVDLSFPMLQLAQQVLDTGEARYPRRETGVVFQPITSRTPFARLPNVDFWLCDAMSLPFPAGSAGTVSALNMLDCVPSPLTLLNNIETLLTTGGQALIGCPYDWASSATGIEHWIGGHSQRGPYQGDPSQLLTALLTANAHPQSLEALHLVDSRPDVEWKTRLHARSTTTYRTHLVAAKKSAGGA